MRCYLRDLNPGKNGTGVYSKYKWVQRGTSVWLHKCIKDWKVQEGEENAPRACVAD